jgi:hypothetical protein
MKMNKPNQVYFNKSISKMFGLKRIGWSRLHKQSFQCTQYAHFNDCTNRR